MNRAQQRRDGQQPQSVRPREQRIEEALELAGIRDFATTCPEDYTMYPDAVKSLRRDPKSWT